MLRKVLTRFLMGCVCLVLTTPLSGKEDLKSIEDYTQEEWIPISQYRWSRSMMKKGEKIIMTVAIVQSEVIFQVLSSCPVPNESNVLMWHAGSEKGLVLDCKNQASISESPPLWEIAFGDLPYEVSYTLKWIRSYFAPKAISLT